MAASRPKYCYRVNAADQIVWVDELWLAFAAENGAPQLTTQWVLGRCLWDFVEGEEPRRLFEDIHARVRESKKTFVFTFRCDSPTLQRQMQLKISPGEQDDLQYESVLLRVVPQRSLAVFDPRQPRTDATLTICSCCKRALLEPLGWLEAKEISERLRLFESRRLPQLCHSICPSCAAAMSGSAPNGGAA